MPPAPTRDARRMRDGDRMLIRCDGGRALARAVRFPPPLELPADDGVYVLVDDGPPEHWSYLFVPEAR